MHVSRVSNSLCLKEFAYNSTFEILQNFQISKHDLKTFKNLTTRFHELNIMNYVLTRIWTLTWTNEEKRMNNQWKSLQSNKKIWNIKLTKIKLVYVYKPRKSTSNKNYWTKVKKQETTQKFNNNIKQEIMNKQNKKNLNNKHA